MRPAIYDFGLATFVACLNAGVFALRFVIRSMSIRKTLYAHTRTHACDFVGILALVIERMNAWCESIRIDDTVENESWPMQYMQYSNTLPSMMIIMSSRD